MKNLKFFGGRLLCKIRTLLVIACSYVMVTVSTTTVHALECGFFEKEVRAESCVGIYCAQAKGCEQDTTFTILFFGAIGAGVGLLLYAASASNEQVVSLNENTSFYIQPDIEYGSEKKIGARFGLRF